MAKADEILAKMGISDSVPLSEAAVEPVHAVGKKYNEDLPQIDDAQRLALLEACGAVDSDQTEIDDTDAGGSDSIPDAEEEVAIKFKPARKLVKANPKAKPTPENPVVVVADNKNYMVSKALKEMTTVGMIAPNMAGAQKKKSRKLPKGDRATNKYVTNTFNEL